jgi:hypothetical protein
MPSKPFLLIGTPCYGGLVAQGYMESIVGLMVYGSAQGFDMTLALNGHDSLITRSRNKIVSAFLDMPQATHLMFIDADISFGPEAVHRLLQFDQDVAAGMYPIKNIDWQRLHGRLTPQTNEAHLRELGLNFVGTPLGGKDREERDGFVAGSYAGTGFMLIKRRVLERMIAAYPETKFDLAHTSPRVAKQSPNQYALFDCMIEKGTNIYLSEDFAFCQRWRALGGKIWLDAKSRLTHIGVYSYEGAPELSLVAGPAGV